MLLSKQVSIKVILKRLLKFFTRETNNEFPCSVEAFLCSFETNSNCQLDFCREKNKKDILASSDY